MIAQREAKDSDGQNCPAVVAIRRPLPMMMASPTRVPAGLPGDQSVGEARAMRASLGP